MARNSERKETLWKSVMQEIRKTYLSGKQRSGDCFPSLNEICAKYGVSKVTGLKVVSELEKLGLVERIQGKGTFIRGRSNTEGIKVVMNFAGYLQYPHVLPLLWYYMQGIEEACRSLHIPVQMVAPEYLDEFATSEDLLILLDPYTGDSVIKRVIGRKLRCVLLHLMDKIEGFSSVRADHKKAIQLCVEHLVKRGHKRLAFLSGPVESDWYAPRFRGYLAGLDAAGIAFDLKLVAETNESNPNVEETDAIMKGFLSCANPPTAIVAANDLRAIAALSYCKRNSIKVPEQIALTGMDGRHEGTVSDPPLTTVDGMFRKQGIAAVQLLMEMSDKKDFTPKDVVIQPQLIVRKSS